MHLGRFNAVIFDLAVHFQHANLPARLEKCAASLDQFIASKAVADLEAFRSRFQDVLKAAEVTDPELKQPFARQVISELSLDDVINPQFSADLQIVVHDRAYDHPGIASDFKSRAKLIAKKINQVVAIDKGFTDLSVEYERVRDSEAEVGLLLPREAVGDTLTALTDELAKLDKFFRAINELTAASNYDPKIRTVSSSWWQVFVSLDAAQVLVWVVVIERIIALFKSNLEIKELQQRLKKQEVSDEIVKLIEDEIEQRVSTGLKVLASDLRKEYAKSSDEGRLNEIETQLRHGLTHLAVRISQGAKVEINVSVPDETDAAAKGDDVASVDPMLSLEAQKLQHQIVELEALRARALAASSNTLSITSDSPSLLDYASKDEGSEKP